ncbi:MAG: MT-A70 family methyltransferase [Pseudomonadota bacterium]
MGGFYSFDQIPLFTYDLIMADCAWLFENWSEAGTEKNASSQYDCMELDDIKALPVGHFAKPNALLWLWATNPMLPQAIETLQAWGFKFVTAGHWVKTTKNDCLNMGPGYVLRCSGEPYLIAVNEDCEAIDEGSPFLIGSVGSPSTVAKNVRSVILGRIRGHSRKPEEAYRACEALLPNARRLDLFSRQRREGWDVAGNEIDKFKGEAA